VEQRSSRSNEFCKVTKFLQGEGRRWRARGSAFHEGEIARETRQASDRTTSQDVRARAAKKKRCG